MVAPYFIATGTLKARAELSTFYTIALHVSVWATFSLTVFYITMFPGLISGLFLLLPFYTL